MIGVEIHIAEERQSSFGRAMTSQGVKSQIEIQRDRQIKAWGLRAWYRTWRGVVPAAGAGLSAGGVSRIQLAEPEVLTDQELWLCGQEFKGTGKLTLGGCALGTGRGVLPAAGAGLSAGGVSRIQLAEPEVLTDQELWLCGQAGRLLRGEIEARESLPER